MTHLEPLGSLFACTGGIYEDRFITYQCSRRHTISIYLMQSPVPGELDRTLNLKGRPPSVTTVLLLFLDSVAMTLVTDPHPASTVLVLFYLLKTRLNNSSGEVTHWIEFYSSIHILSIRLPPLALVRFYWSLS